MIKAYPGLEGAEFFETLAIEHLCNGLPDPNMAFDILVKKRRTIKQALDMIEWYECCRQTSRRGPVLRQVSPSVPDNDQETAGGAVRHIGPNRQWVTKERLQQFGQELQGGLTKSLSKTMAEQLQAAVAKWPRAGPVHTQTGTRAEVKLVERTLRTTRPCDPRSSGPRRPGQDQTGSWGACFKCGGSGHFARECSNRVSSTWGHCGLGLWGNLGDRGAHSCGRGCWPGHWGPGKLPGVGPRSDPGKLDCYWDREPIV